jgi:hypothetical protein
MRSLMPKGRRWAKQLGQLINASNQTPTPRSIILQEAMATSAAKAAPPPALRPQQVEETSTVYAVFAIQ